MNSAPVIAVVVAGSIALFLVAAKVHGRELRLERERQALVRGDGMNVVFGSSTNPAWVEALWKAERVRFWGWTAAGAVVAVAACTLLRPSGALWACALVSWAPSLSFLACTALSLLRGRA